MKSYLTLFWLSMALPLGAQQPNLVPQQRVEPDVPTVLQAEAQLFLIEFQKTAQFLADKSNEYTQKVYRAETFVKKFRTDAVIEVMNGKKVIKLTPLQYFHRLIDLKYEQVNITFKLVKNNGVNRVEKDQYKSQYVIQQDTRLSTDGTVVYADYTIKTIDMFFVYTPQTKTWTKQYGHVKALQNQRTQ